jgi:hypothetical protein
MGGKVIKYILEEELADVGFLAVILLIKETPQASKDY